MSSPSPPQPRPEGALIKTALKRSRLSARKAATLAGISEGRWRQIMNGYQTVSRGMHIPVVGPDETLAAMADVVDVAPEQLVEAGRPGAAEVLRLVRAEQAKRNSEPTDEELAATTTDPRWQMLEASISAAGAGLSSKERVRLRKMIEKFLREQPEWQPPAVDPAGGHEQAERAG